MTHKHRALVGRIGGTAFSTYGAGEPVVLIHGVGMEQAFWGPQINALAGDCQIVTYDMLGHGNSRDPDEDTSLADYAGQLADLMDALGIAAANVVGHSMGALVALEYATSHPDRTLRVAALNAVFMRSPEQKAAIMGRAEQLRVAGMNATVDATLSRWFGDSVPEHLHEAADMISGILSRVHPIGYARTYQLFAQSDAVHADRLADLRMPALFMTGELDPNSAPSMSMAMAQRVPESTLVVIPGARHMMSITDPAAVNEALRAFLRTPLGRGASEHDIPGRTGMAPDPASIENRGA